MYYTVQSGKVNIFLEKEGGFMRKKILAILLAVSLSLGGEAPVLAASTVEDGITGKASESEVASEEESFVEGQTLDPEEESAVLEETLPSGNEESASGEETEEDSGEVFSETEGLYDKHEQAQVEEQGEAVYVNPLYADVITEEEILKQAGEANETSPRMLGRSAVSTYSSWDKTVSYVRKSLVSRTKNIQYNYSTSKTFSSSNQMLNYFMKLIQCSFLDDGTTKPWEGDYLAYQYGGYTCYVSANRSSSGRYLYQVRYAMIYYTTASQEAKVTSRVNQLLDSMNLESKDGYQKVKAIYDYVIRHVTYDYATLNDASYGKYTAYKALFQNTAVCQGYANLIYRMMKEAGISCRIITGDAGGRHAWNIVKVGDKFYNMDSTWDAGTTYYTWFLKSQRDFTGHTRDQKFTTSSFNSRYSMASTSFSYVPLSRITLSRSSLRMETGDTTTLYFNRYPSNAISDSGYWSSSNAAVVAVSQSGKLTIKKAGSATIRLRMGKCTASCLVTVEKAEPSTPNPTAKCTAYYKNVISWKATSKADGYRVYGKNSSGHWAKIADVTGCSYTDTGKKLGNGLVPGKVYAYTVRAYRRKGGKVLWSSCVKSGVRVRTINSAPALVSATPTLYNRIWVTWKKTPKAAGYRIYRRTVGGSWKTLKDVSASTTKYADNTATPSVKYIYTVRAYSKYGGHRYYGMYSSAGVTGQTKLGQDSISYIGSKSAGKVALTWKRVSGATGYQVYRKTGAGGSYKRVKYTSGLKFTDSGLKKGTTYYYKVRAYRKIAAGKYAYGAFSAEKKVTSR